MWEAAYYLTWMIPQWAAPPNPPGVVARPCRTCLYCLRPHALSAGARCAGCGERRQAFTRASLAQHSARRNPGIFRPDDPDGGCNFSVFPRRRNTGTCLVRPWLPGLGGFLSYTPSGGRFFLRPAARHAAQHIGRPGCSGIRGRGGQGQAGVFTPRYAARAHASHCRRRPD